MQWSHLDPTASGYIPREEFPTLMFSLKKPLGWDETVLENKNYQDKFIENMDLPLYNNEEDYLFLDVLEVLSMRLFIKDQLRMKNNKDEEIKQRIQSSKSPV